jgi:hypothetical protein
MDWIESESLWFVYSNLTDAFVWLEAFGGLETPAAVVSVDEDCEAALELPAVFRLLSTAHADVVSTAAE